MKQYLKLIILMKILKKLRYIRLYKQGNFKIRVKVNLIRRKEDLRGE